MKHRNILYYLSIIILLFIGCKPNELKKNNTKNPTQITIYINEQPLKVDIADTEEKRAKGLMDRKNLPSDEGMLFIHPHATQLSYWMKDTYLELDIGFFNEQGQLCEIYSLYPHSLTPITSKSTHLKFALEVNRNWFKNHHVSIGSQLILPN